MKHRITQWRSTLSSLASSDTRSELAAAFTSGEEWAFAEIYGRYQKPVSRYISQRISDPETAQELTQEVFLKIHRFRASYQPEYALSTWIWTIARNTVFDSLRKERGSDDQVSGSLDSDLHAVDELPCLKPDAEALLNRKSERRLLIRLLRKLTQPQRRVIWMRVIHNLTYEEIARKLGMSLSAVKCLAHRSKQALLPAAPQL